MYSFSFSKKHGNEVLSVLIKINLSNLTVIIYIN